MARETTGRLTELPHQNCETMAQAVPGTSAQHFPEFLTNLPWDAADVNRQRVRKMIAGATPGAGGLVLDETGVPQQGKASVGGARQDSGSLGKVGHGQVTWPVAVWLDVPRTWAEDPGRRRRPRVSAEVRVQIMPRDRLELAR